MNKLFLCLILLSSNVAFAASSLEGKIQVKGEIATTLINSAQWETIIEGDGPNDREFKLGANAAVCYESINTCEIRYYSMRVKGSSIFIYATSSGYGKVLYNALAKDEDAQDYGAVKVYLSKMRTEVVQLDFSK